MGSAGIAKELDYVGIENFGVGPDVLNSPVNSILNDKLKDPDVGAVIVGFDEHIR